MKDYLKNRKNIFPPSDWFDLNFHGGFLTSQSPITNFLSEQTHKIGEEKLSSRVLNHWYEVGILKDDRPNGKGWKKFSISELIWIRVVIKLRGFGLDLARIKKVKEEIDIYNSSKSISHCPLLDFHIFLAISSSIPVKLVVFESGEANVVRQIDIDIANQLGMLKEDFISIDLNKLVHTFFKKKKYSTDYLGYSDIPKSPILKEIEKSLSADDIQAITIRANGKDYVVDEEFFIKDKVKANALISMLSYGSLVEKKNAGKSTYSVTNKKKVKKG
jgi:DNA-binding transcriptional MerR regulator